MTSHVSLDRPASRVGAPPSPSRARPAAVLVAIGLLLVGLGAALPWVTLFNGLEPVRGFRLDGGDLSGLAVGSAGLLAIAVRHGGGVVLRPFAAGGALLVVAGSLAGAHRIADYVADPGPAAALTTPSAGVGPVVMAVGGAALTASALVAPVRAVPLDGATRSRLLLAGVTFVAGWMHLVLTPEHLAESTLLGLGFLGAGLAQLALVVALVVSLDTPGRPAERLLALVVVLNTALIAVWAYAVLVGLPLGAAPGHDQAGASGIVIGAGEPVDVAAVVTKTAEIVGIGVALALTRRRPGDVSAQSSPG